MEVTDELYARGFRPAKLRPTKQDCVLRSSWLTDRTRILTPTKSEPWWTVQRVNGQTVRWFIDVPVDVSRRVLLAIVDEMDRT